MLAAVGTIEQQLIVQTREDTAAFIELVKILKNVRKSLTLLINQFLVFINPSIITLNNSFYEFD